MNRNSFQYKLTDQGNSERFATHWKGHLIHVGGIGWFLYDGKRWNQADRGEQVECAKKSVRKMYVEASECLDNEDYRRALVKHALSCESEGRLMAMLRLAQSDPKLAVGASMLDVDTMKLNVRNGTIDLRTGKLHAHTPTDFITKLAPVDYDMAAKCPTWLKFLDRIFSESEPLISYVQRLIGNAATGDASTQYLPIFHGAGANGKSTLLGTIQAIMGDYSCNVPDTLLTADRKEHPTELFTLRGKRLAVASETESGAKFRMQTVKKLTGETTLTARKMYGDYFDFPRTHHIILQSNNLPRITEDSEAVWRRIRLVPFNVIIPIQERDAQLGEKLMAEASGILMWILFGCLSWQKEGLEMPEEVQDANRHYREESDPIGDFVDDCCVLGPDVHVSSGRLRAAYEAFCASQGFQAMNGKLFAQRIEKLGCSTGRNHSGRFWSGIGVLNQPFANAEA